MHLIKLIPTKRIFHFQTMAMKNCPSHQRKIHLHCTVEYSLDYTVLTGIAMLTCNSIAIHQHHLEHESGYKCQSKTLQYISLMAAESKRQQLLHT